MFKQWTIGFGCPGGPETRLASKGLRQITIGHATEVLCSSFGSVEMAHRFSSADLGTAPDEYTRDESAETEPPVKWCRYDPDKDDLAVVSCWSHWHRSLKYARNRARQ
jgi:hypothetical protein